MANGFNSVVKQNWERGLQAVLEKSCVSMDLATMKIIPDGVTINIPRLAFQSTQTYVKYTDLSFADLTTASDTLTLDTNAVVTFSMDDLDEDDNYINITPNAIRQGGVKLKERLDGDFLNQILNANLVYDNAGLRPNTGTITPIALTTGASQNVAAVFGGSQAALINAGVDMSRLALVVDAFTMNTINTLGLETGFDVADEAFQNKLARGYRGRFLGLEVYVAGCITSSRVFDMATNPTAADTITINGQVFTFVAAIGATPGNVLIGGSAAATQANFAALLNAPGVTTANGVAVTDPSRFEGLTAAVAANAITVVSRRGTTISSSSNNGANDWQAETLNCAIMEKGAIWMALRDNLKVRDAREPKKLVTNYTVLTRYGIVTPASGRERMVRIALQSIAAEA